MNDTLQIPMRVDLGDGTAPIAMVDDESLDYQLVRRFHARSGLANPLRHFEDGQTFIDYLGRVKDGAEPLPVLVLMDINMPRMSGFETIAAMRGDAQFRDIPVVMMLTSSTDRRDREQAVAAGADGYLVKPFNPSCYRDLFASLAAA